MKNLLSENMHMHDKINKAYAMLGIIKRNFNYLTISSFVLSYKNLSGDEMANVNFFTTSHM